jgi:peptidoglycan/LPS O-acetylase OafA/YrhL
MAYTLNQFRPPAHATWGFIRSRYVAGEKGLVKDDLTYLVHHPYVGLFAAGGIVALYALRNHGDDAASLMRGAIVGAVVLLLVAPNFTALRLELPFVPLAAYGVALALDAVRRRAPRGPMPVPGRRLVRRGGGT